MPSSTSVILTSREVPNSSMFHLCVVRFFQGELRIGAHCEMFNSTRPHFDARFLPIFRCLTDMCSGTVDYSAWSK